MVIYSKINVLSKKFESASGQEKSRKQEERTEVRDYCSFTTIQYSRVRQRREVVEKSRIEFPTSDCADRRKSVLIHRFDLRAPYTDEGWVDESESPGLWGKLFGAKRDDKEPDSESEEKPQSK